MRIIFSFLALACLLTSCDDGDIITAELEFGDTFVAEDCEDKLICYKIKTSPSESLSTVLDITLDELFETLINPDNPLLINLVNSEPTPNVLSFNYRTYNNVITGDVFCNAIPPSNLGVTNDYVAFGVNAQFFIVLNEDDDDGIPAELEDLNGDGDLENDDTDGDGLPNYIDADDDGDNVLTSTELFDFSGLDTDNNPLTNPEDTDGDGIPNYLDPDDDGDAILTINEENVTQNQNPADDIDNNDVGPDYLNPLVVFNIPATAYAEHTIKKEFQAMLTLININLEVLTQDELPYGIFIKTDSREVTPEF